MPDFSAWMNWRDTEHLEGWLDDANPASEVAFIVGHRGVSITLVRGSTPLAAQTVLLVPASGGRTTTPEPTGGAGVAGKDYVFLIGTRGHPTLADFNVARGDRFTLDGARYEVTYVDKTMAGKTEARAEAMR